MLNIGPTLCLAGEAARRKRDSVTDRDPALVSAALFPWHPGL
jgi:hypothetical protein